MQNNLLSEFFQSKTELSAIDHFLGLTANNYFIEERLLRLEDRLKIAEQLKYSYLEQIEQLKKQHREEILELKKQLELKGNNTIFGQEVQIINPVVTSNASALEELKEGMWSDSITGLMWARISIGQEWVNGTGHGEAKWIHWNSAESLCKKLRLGGFDDWRLPSIDELRTLMKINQPGYNSPLGMLLVPKHENLGCFWSSSTINATIVNSIDFNKGCLMNYNRLQQDGYVRAVRNIKSVDHAK